MWKSTWVRKSSGWRATASRACLAPLSAIGSTAPSIAARCVTFFLFIGADPNTDWLEGCVDLDSKGFVVTGNGAQPLETSLPGVFAIGDVRAGSTKRVAAAVGEGGAAVVAQIHAMIAKRTAREDA